MILLFNILEYAGEYIIHAKFNRRVIGLCLEFILYTVDLKVSQAIWFSVLLLNKRIAFNKSCINNILVGLNMQMVPENICREHLHI